MNSPTAKTNVLSSVLFFSLITIVIIACRRETTQEVNSGFDSEAAKEWYYGIFKKLPEFQQSSIKGNQLPDWSNGRHHTIGSMEIMEFPLMQRKKLVSLEGGSTPASRRLAEATLSRILFIKSSDGVHVREVDYIPDAQYGEAKGFDISANSIGNLEKNFSGRLRIKKWGGTELSVFLIRQGRIETKGKRLGSATGTMARGENCTTYEICEMERTCREEMVGDVWVKTDDCTEWQPTGVCWFETYCEGDGTDPCAGMDEEQCVCMMMGICDGGGNEERTCADKQADMASAGSVMSEKESVTETSNDGVRRYKDYVWKVYSVSNGLIPMYLVSTEKGVHKKDNVGLWKWESLSHHSVSKRGTEILYSTSVSNESATITYDDHIYNPPTTAYISLRFDVKISAVCDGVPIAYNTTPTPSTSWHVSE